MTNPPEWLGEFADRVAALVLAVDVLAPVGCHFCFESGVWEVTLFAAKTEIVGGPRDGLQRPSRFCLDLAGLTALFTAISSFHWQAHSLGRRDDLGAHIAVEGEVAGHRVWLRVPARVPETLDIGAVAHLPDRRWKEAW
ncbi:MAG TPA: hypothetical protein VFG20_22700 [Planctomycetaceae bacterium]|nr:hypothetical protein [Planctomycetaceae bacterium]